MDELDLYVDGGSRGNPGPAAGAVLIRTRDSDVIHRAGYYLGETTNNVAEYTALLQGVRTVRKLGARQVNIFSDSELLVRQLVGQYRVRNRRLEQLLDQVQRELVGFDRWQIQHVSRSANREADLLVNQALDAGRHVADADPEAPSVPEKTSSRQAGGVERGGGPAVVLVRCTKGASAGVCGANMTADQCFAFSSVLPAGLCVSAASVIVPAVVQLREGSLRGVVTVECPVNGCGARFSLSLAE